MRNAVEGFIHSLVSGVSIDKFTIENRPRWHIDSYVRRSRLDLDMKL
jgi:hypothetical protein